MSFLDILRIGQNNTNCHMKMTIDYHIVTLYLGIHLCEIPSENGDSV